VSGKSHIKGIPFPSDNNEDDDDNDEYNYEDEEKRISNKQQRMRQERAERAARQASTRANPLSFGLDADAAADWSLADAFGANSSLVRAVFKAFQDATQILAKVEVELGGLVRIFLRKFDHDIKTTQVRISSHSV
jgi:FtsZ-interacting cell division protein YlmF